MSLYSPSAWIARLLRIAGIVLLVIGVCPNYVMHGGPAHHSEQWTVGMSSSPLFTYLNSSTEELGAGGVQSVTKSSSWDVGFLSWSMVALVGAVVLLALARALRREVDERSNATLPPANGS